MPSTEPDTIRISVAFAAPTKIWRRQLDVPARTTVQEALAMSGFTQEFPEFTDHFPAVGVFGERCSMDRTLRAGDRIELYRPLVFDPQETRRRRAQHRESPTQPRRQPPPTSAHGDSE